MLTILKNIKNGSHLFPLIVFHLVFLALVIGNLPPSGTFFIGWDALNPEFDFLLNLKRSFSAFWQENYGVGLLSGHGFAATLPHTIITFLLSFVLPTELIRFSFTFLCLYIGGIGMYFLMYSILKLIQKENTFISLVSALFYTLNLATVQMFSLPLEAFVAHFAALPWLFWILIRVVNNPSGKNLLLFFLINFISSIQGFIPSLFASYFIGLLILLSCFVFSRTQKILAFKKALFVFLLTICVNLYWILPVAYFQITRSDTFINSYNNIASTQHFIDVNQKYGDFESVALLKGLFFDSYELGDYVLSGWISHLNNFYIPVLGILLFFIIISGVILSIFSIKHWLIRGLSLIFLFFFASLATSTLPFSLLTKLLQFVSPTYEQAFRNAFTKFSIDLAFTYSIFLGLGVLLLSRIIFRIKPIFFFALVSLVLLIFSFPAFTGGFVYRKLMIQIPNAYFDVMSYFKSQGDGRIADFPQDCTDGWYAYRWGYFGSGFYWYGIKQPFLSRPFDVWSNHNENYYWEIMQSLREQDFKSIDNIFEKYQVRWVLYDPNIIFCRDQRAIFTHQEFINHLNGSQDYKLVKTFQSDNIFPISLYEVSSTKQDSYISLHSDLVKIAPEYERGDKDIAYQAYRTYITSKSEEFDIYYPFQALFTKRGYTENNLSIESGNTSIIFKTKIPKNLEGHSLTIPAFSKIEKSLPVGISFIPKDGRIADVEITYYKPKIILDGILLTSESITAPVGQILLPEDGLIKIFVNGQEIEGNIAAFYSTLPNNSIVLQDSLGKLLLSWSTLENAPLALALQNPDTIKIPLFSQGELKIEIPKVIAHQASFLKPSSCSFAKPVNPGRFEIASGEPTSFVRLIDQNSNQCLILDIPNIPTSFPYIVEVNSRHISGNFPIFSISNKEKTVFNDVFIYSNNLFNPSYYIIPPTFPNELGLKFRIENVSENNEETINDFASISLFQIPYEFMKNITVQQPARNAEPRDSDGLNNSINVSHPNETIYILSNLDLPMSGEQTLVLSQAFDEGWKAYEINVKCQMSPARNATQSVAGGNVKCFLVQLFPFLFGEELKEHVMVNNWANGWVIDKCQMSPARNATQSVAGGNVKCQIVIVFLPQYLQYFGFIILIGTLFIILWKTSREKSLQM